MASSRSHAEHHRERKRCLEILELPEAATEVEIKTSFKALARQWHPDKNSSEGATEKMQEITAAYDYLIKGHEEALHDHEDDDLFDIYMHLFPWLRHLFTFQRGYYYADPFGYDDSSDDDDDDYYYVPTGSRRRGGQGPTFSHERDYSSGPRPAPGAQFVGTDKASRRREKKQRQKQRKKAEKVAAQAEKKGKGEPHGEDRDSDSQKSATPPPHAKEEKKENVAPSASSSQASNKGGEKEEKTANGEVPSQQQQPPPTSMPAKKTKQQIKEEERRRQEEIEKIRRDLEAEMEEERERKARKQAAKEERERQEAEERRLQEEMEIAEEARRIREELQRKEEEAERKKREAEEAIEMAKLMSDFDDGLFLDASGDFVTTDTSGVGNIKKLPVVYDASGYHGFSVDEPIIQEDWGDFPGQGRGQGHHRGQGDRRGRGFSPSPPRGFGLRGGMNFERSPPPQFASPPPSQTSTRGGFTSPPSFHNSPEQMFQGQGYSGFNDQHRGRGGFQGNRGGFQGNRGGYQGNTSPRGRGGYQENRGGYQGNRGGYQGNRGDYQGNRGGFQGNTSPRGRGKGQFHAGQGQTDLGHLQGYEGEFEQLGNGTAQPPYSRESSVGRDPRQKEWSPPNMPPPGADGRSPAGSQPQSPNTAAGTFHQFVARGGNSSNSASPTKQGPPPMSVRPPSHVPSSPSRPPRPLQGMPGFPGQPPPLAAFAGPRPKGPAPLLNFQPSFPTQRPLNPPSSFPTQQTVAPPPGFSSIPGDEVFVRPHQATPNSGGYKTNSNIRPAGYGSMQNGGSAANNAPPPGFGSSLAGPPPPPLFMSAAGPPPQQRPYIPPFGPARTNIGPPGKLAPKPDAAGMMGKASEQKGTGIGNLRMPSSSASIPKSSAAAMSEFCIMDEVD